MKLNPIVDHINKLALFYYQHGENISIDESLECSKVGVPYMPNKHHARLRTKLAESNTLYIIKLYIYGPSKYDPGTGIGYDVVNCLLNMS